MKKEKLESLVKKLQPFSAGAAMADMAMLLLIFFMATTSTTPPLSSKVEIPMALTEPLMEETMRLTVVDEAKVFINDTLVKTQDLDSYLRTQNFSQEKPVMFLADRRISYAKIDQILQILGKNQYYKINFIAEHSLKIQ